MIVVCVPNCIFLSETSRMIAIYESLKELNIKVTMATHGGPYEFVLKKHNIPYKIIEPKVSRAFYHRYMQSIYDSGRTQNYTIDELRIHVQGEIDYFRQIEASLIVTGFALTARLSSAACNIPLVVTHLGSWTPITLEKYGVIVSEVFRNLYTQFIPGNWLNAFGSWLFPRIKSYTKIFNQVAKEIGLPPFKSLFDLLLGDHTLITDVPEILGISEEEVLAWRPDNKNQYRSNIQLAYSGPIFGRLFGEAPDDVLNFLNTDKPKIYIAMNSGQFQDLKIVYDTVSRLDVMAVMVSTIHDNTLFRSPNILTVPFLPSHKIMPLCDLAIINGGQGTIQTAIASGTPIIGFPLQPEQNFNLQRVSDLGAGLCMGLFDLRRGNLTYAIKKILEDSVYHQNAGILKDLQMKRDGPHLTAQYIQKLLID